MELNFRWLSRSSFRRTVHRFGPSSRKRSRLWMEINFSWLSRSSFRRTTQTVVRSTQTLWCATSRRPLWKNSEIEEALNLALPLIQEILEKWMQRGSGWVVNRVETLWLDIARYQPLRGGSYIPTPPALRAKKAILNIKTRMITAFGGHSDQSYSQPETMLTVKVPYWWWADPRRVRFSHSNLSDSKSWGAKQPGHQRLWVG